MEVETEPPAGSFSPDSGLACDLEEVYKQHLLDPPQRRLSKSLSADSEWSLDPSLFEAEDLLRDMGFAGPGDPTIPDRFLPSLMQRLAKFPESEMESLHDRIIQSIGCFRRKESKRRLFRNFSMGKDSRRFLGCQHPFLRSNTDPSSFPYDDATSTSASSLMSLSSTSNVHSLRSSTSDLPASPIAILVSEASVDQDQQTSASSVHSQQTTAAADYEQQTCASGAHGQQIAPATVDCEQHTSIDDQKTGSDIGNEEKRTNIMENVEKQSSRIFQDQQELGSEDCDQQSVLTAACNQRNVPTLTDFGEVVDAAIQADLDSKRRIKNNHLQSKEKSTQSDSDISEVDNATDQPYDDIAAVNSDALVLHKVDSKLDAAPVSPCDDNSSQPDDDMSYGNGDFSDVATVGSSHDIDVSQLEDNVPQPDDDLTKFGEEDVSRLDMDAIQIHNDDFYIEQSVSQNEDNVHQSVDDLYKLGGNGEDTPQNVEEGRYKTVLQIGGETSQFDSGIHQSIDDFSDNDSNIYLDSLECDNNVSQSGDINIEDVYHCNKTVFLSDDAFDKNSLHTASEQKVQCVKSNLNNEVKLIEFPNDFSPKSYENDVSDNSNRLHFNDMINLNNRLDPISNSNGSICDNQIKNDNFTNSKTPLRRTSNSHFYNPENIRMFDNIQYQNNIDISSPANTAKEIKNEGQYKVCNTNVVELENALNEVRSFNEVVLNSAGFFQSESVANKVSLKSMPYDNNSKRSKPKYSRDNSLTNFLSSMLDTGDVTRPSVPVPNPLSEKVCNSDSEVPGSFATTPFTSFGALDSKSKFFSNVKPKPNLTTSTPIKSFAKVQELIDKAPNRKRRVLRRMSSSLQCCDDENCGSNVIRTDSCDDDVPQLPNVEMNPMPKISHGNLISESTNHREIHSCNSLPVSSSRRGHDACCENNCCQTQQTKTRCNCDVNVGRHFSHSSKCKRKRNLSCPFPEMSFSPSVMYKPKVMRCSYVTYEHPLTSDIRKSCPTQCNFSANNGFSNFSRCSCANSNCRLNLCYTAPQSNVCHSSNSEHCDSNGRCFGPPSPSLIRPDNFGSDIWSQSRHLCYSSPDLSQDCCSDQFGHCAQRSFTDIDECPFNVLELYGTQSFRGNCNATDDLFPRHRSGYCPFHHNHCLPRPERLETSRNLNDQDPKTKKTTRTPQRQNSISFADSEIPTQNPTNNDNNLPNESNAKTFNVKKDCQPTLSYADAASKNISKTSTSSEMSSTKLTQDNKPSLTLDTEEPKNTSSKTPSSPTTKSEALLERKIRIFSKFLANLGNLSKSFSDTDTDNKHKRTTRDQKTSDAPNVDKKTKNRALKVSCPVVQSKRQSVPELDKLLELLKSMDPSNKSAEDTHKVPDEISAVSEQRPPQELCQKEYPLYENKIQLQCIGGERSILYEPVLYSSTVSLYVNAEDKMDIPKERNESVLDGDKKVEEPSSKKEQLLDRSLSQMAFRGVSKELEDLQLSIQKAKETRMCASKELHLLQELLSMDVTSEQRHAAKEKTITGVEMNRCDLGTISKSTDAQHSQALADLREKSKKEVLEDTSFWKAEIEKVKEETKQAWQAKLERLEARLASQEDELRRLQGETTLCKTTENGRTDSAFEDDDDRRPTTPLQCRRVDCERLQRRLVEEEQRADELNLALNQKSIELNKLQIALSRQTKEMIELEKSYLQLQCRLRRGTSKPLVSRLCSRASPFAPKNLCPKPPSPPPPTNGTTT